MDLYTLNPNFLASAYIDQFVSAIWTERYSLAGDFQLVLPATENNLEILSEGTFLGLRGSKDVMIIETIEIENGLMTVTGPDLITFLNQRFVWYINPSGSATIENRVVDYLDTTRKPGEFISHVVDQMVINTTVTAGGAGTKADANLSWDMEEIPFLTLGAIDTSGVVEQLVIPIGPLYDGIAQVAKDKGVGISLYLESANPDTGYSLKFKTYQGLDRTQDQSVNDLVRLSPQLDQISNLKELRSNKLYKNVAYIYYQGKIYKHLAEPLLPEPEGLDRRVIVRSAEGEPPMRKVDSVYNYSRYAGYQQYSIPDIPAFIEQTAKDTFANANYIRNIDGETSPNSEYKFGVDYGLGDIIELEGLTGLITKARVTEFIRSQDRQGEKVYPTISVLDEAGGG